MSIDWPLLICEVSFNSLIIVIQNIERHINMNMFFNEDIVYHHKNYEITKLKGNLFANKGKLDIRLIPIISLDLFLCSKSRYLLLFNKI